MFEITNEADLLNWLAEQLKHSEPRADILEGYIHVFDDVISLFSEDRRLQLWHSDWSDYLQETFGIINRFPAQQACSVRILDFLSTIYGEVIQSGDQVPRRRAIRVLMELLDIDDQLIRRKRIGKQSYWISTAQFEVRYGTRVQVKRLRRKKIQTQFTEDFFTI
jgi:hypothetical protein